MYKIAISDLDGTLLGPDHKISTQTKAIIHQWIRSGRKFVIATGRHYIEAKTLQEQLGEEIYLISSNGARVHNKSGEMILTQNLPAPIANEICNITFDPGVHVNLFTDDHWYTNFHLQEMTDIALDKAFSCQAIDLKKVDKNNVIKIFFWAEPELLQPIYEQLLTRFGDKVNLTFSLKKCLEVMDVNTNKGSAVKAVLRDKGLQLDDAIAFGDAMNDVEMLSIVAKPILMANSQPQLLQSLPKAERTLTAKEHGVAIKMEKILTE